MISILYSCLNEWTETRALYDEEDDPELIQNPLYVLQPLSRSGWVQWFR